MNNYIEKIDRDLFAADFEKAAKFDCISKEAIKDIMTISKDGCFVINKPLDKNDYQVSIDFVRSIMQLEISDINTEHGFCKWIRGISSQLEKYPDESILKLRMVDTYKKFWIIYQNLCEAEAKRRALRKKWILSHPLVFLKGVFEEGS